MKVRNPGRQRSEVGDQRSDLAHCQKGIKRGLVPEAAFGPSRTGIKATARQGE